MSEAANPANPDELDARATGEKLAEMVAAEAAAAEAETPEDEDEEGADSEDQKFQNQVIAAYERYMTEIVQLFGADVTVTPCTYCHGFGFNPVTLNADPHSHPCDTCGGRGEVATYSLVPGNEARQCLDCKGAGYVADPIELAPVVMPDASPVTVLSEAEIADIVANAQRQAGANAA